MKAIVQRVTESSVSINGNIHSEIKSGLCILIGYCKDDQQSVNTWLKDKLLGLRVF
ncbi:MAG: D-aminoacyl-tRNA deacylase, partial [Bacteroidota bacterium]